MDFIKKHYEKIVLAGVLLVLIASAGFLAFRVSALSEEISAAPGRLKLKGKRIATEDMTGYSNAIASLHSPPLWQERSPMFPPDKAPKTTEIQTPVQTFSIRRGQDFDCGGKSYNVVDITSTQVIILDKLPKEKHTISAAGK